MDILHKIVSSSSTISVVDTLTTVPRKQLGVRLLANRHAIHDLLTLRIEFTTGIMTMI